MNTYDIPIHPRYNTPLVKTLIGELKHRLARRMVFLSIQQDNGETILLNKCIGVVTNIDLDEWKITVESIDVTIDSISTAQSICASTDMVKPLGYATGLTGFGVCQPQPIVRGMSLEQYMGNLC